MNYSLKKHGGIDKKDMMKVGSKIERKVINLVH